MDGIKNYVKLLRLSQWTKNVFVLIPAIFAYDKLNANNAAGLAAALMAFCLFSSGVYIINDIFDAENDRLHLRKKFRPIAAGKISCRNAGVFAAVVLVSALSFACFANQKVFFIGVIYVLLNVLYSWRIKYIALIDVFFIAMGFILRVYAGGSVIDAAISPWLMLNTFFLSLFLAFGKRRSELIALSLEPERHRRVLGAYTLDMLNFFLISSCAMTLICYALYTIEPGVTRMIRSQYLIYTVPIAAYGLFRYVFILLQNGEDRDISEIVLSDLGILTATTLWFVVLFIIVIHGLVT